MQFSPKYHLSIRILHWLMAAIIISLLAVGLIMEDLPRSDPLRATLFSLHKSFGITILFLAIIRLGLRLRLGIPPLPDIIPAIERVMAELGHKTLYCFMFALPLSGYLMTNSFGFPVKWFGIELPRLIDADKARGHLLVDFHQYAAYILIGVISVHALAVLWHFLKQRLNLLSRMW